MLQKWENISFLILITLFSIFRADTLYRLCYASILIHWRSYMMYTRESLFQSLFSFDMVTIWQDISHWAAVSFPGVCSHGPDTQHAHCWQQDLWGCFCPCQVRKTTHLSFIFRKNRLSIVLSPCLIHPGIGLSKAVCRLRSWKPSKETSLSSKFSSFPRWLSDKCRARKRKCRTVRHDHNAYYTTVFVSYHMEWT